MHKVKQQLCLAHKGFHLRRLLRKLCPQDLECHATAIGSIERSKNPRRATFTKQLLDVITTQHRPSAANGLLPQGPLLCGALAIGLQPVRRIARLHRCMRALLIEQRAMHKHRQQL